MKKTDIWKLLLTLYITFAGYQLYWVFKEVEIQAIWHTLDATKKEERESKFEREKENTGQEDLKFEGGKTMRYEFEKLQVMPVTREMREWEHFFFLLLFLVSVRYAFTSWNNRISPVCGRYNRYFFRYETKEVSVLVY